MIFTDIIKLTEVDSTNTYLKIGDWKDKTLVYTFNQKNGRGREDREWISFDNKNIALSILFKPVDSNHNNIWYIACLSVALVELLEEYQVNNVWIKWPNDIYVSDKKIAGVLAETLWREKIIERLVVGIGINVNPDLEELKIISGRKTTSVYMETANKVDINMFIEKYLKYLNKWFSAFYKPGGLEMIKDNWKKHCNIINKQIEWINNGVSFIGNAIDIDNDGFLKIKINDEVRTIFSGDVLLYTGNELLKSEPGQFTN